MSIAGVDGCKGGWLAVIRMAGTHAPWLHVVPRFDQIFSVVRDLEMVAVDIPIGLPENNPDERTCDKLARVELGEPRRRSVFPAPIREITGTESFEEAKAASKMVCGKGINRQTFYLLPKIRQVDQVVQRHGQEIIREVHPEVCFWAMAGGKPMEHKKSRKQGHEERRGWLINHFGPDFLLNCEAARKNLPVRAKLDDLYDAMAALWSAERLVEGRAETMPAHPSQDSTGLRMEINY